MQIETLKIFCDLVETRSFSQAAERNFVTQSAVSQQVRGVVAYPEKRRGLEVVPLGGDRLVFICRPDHAFARKKKLRAADLQGQSFILFERDIPTRRATDRNLRAHGVTIQRAAEFDNIETIKRA